MDLFRVRLNCIDHYQATPSRYDPQLRNDVRPSQVSKAPKVPVVRIFGSTETGQKVCAHVHGAFPYLYVEYSGGLASEEVGAFIYRLHLSIDHALAVSYRRDQYGNNAKFVARITLVKGIPFYGFHVGYRHFLKIYVFNPVVMTRLADLLQQGVIMKRKFQPYEAHLQYLLQFMVDYNLYGCDYLDSSKAIFRSPLPQHDQGSNSSHLWHNASVPADFITDDPTLPRVSHCSIEVDICVQDIVNRKMVKERQVHHEFIERTSPIPSDLKFVYSMAGLWKDETKRRQRQLPKAQQHNSPFPPEALVSMSADPRDSQPQGWIHEQEYQQDIQNLICKEAADLDGADVSFETFVKPPEPEPDVSTILQSVEDLYPSKLMPALGLPPKLDNSVLDTASSIEVDEKAALQVQEEDGVYPEDSDEETFQKINETNLPGDHDAQAHSRSPAERRQAGDDTLPPFGEIPGVAFSVLKSGEGPKIPVTDDLLDAAVDDGFLCRVPKRHVASKLDAKRTETETPPGSPASKRLKSSTTEVSPDTRSGAVNPALAARSIPKGPEDPHPKTNSFVSRTMLSIPSGSSEADRTTGSFRAGGDRDGIVKRRNSPSTKRLSHDTGTQKKVSFVDSALGAGGSGSQGHGKVNAVSVPTSGCPQRTFVFAAPPPTYADSTNMKKHDLPDVIYQDAYYSKEKDVPDRSREYAGREYRLESNTVPFLPQFDLRALFPTTQNERADSQGMAGLQREQTRQPWQCGWRSWEYTRPPPAYRTVSQWADKRAHNIQKNVRERRSKAMIQPAAMSQIDGPTPKNKHGFKFTQKAAKTSVQHEVQYMSTMSLEVHVNSRGKFIPNPEQDEIQCIFWACKSDERTYNTQGSINALQSGVLILSHDGAVAQRIAQATNASVAEEDSELDLLVRMVEIVRTFDPDVLTGFEVHGSSWGYLIERARLKYDYDLCDEFSRMRSDSHGRFGKNSDRWGFNTTSTIRVTGRHMINIWRAMQGELNLLQYTMENVIWHLLHRRVPHYSWKTLTKWYKSNKPAELEKLLRYYRNRARLDIEILEANELIARTSEQARLLGVDFFSVFSRGSQFKVESIMSRIAKPENFVFVSPSKKQVGGQNALECLPLVMEPQSAFYSSPLLVLDFQSLYPSVMIAYNYCYSTFLGRIKNWRGTSKMGFTEYERQKGLLVLLKDYINIAPNGMIPESWSKAA
ncbi:DNA-directed DNA polymerase [Purpureocillium takamizusanense]|uniref:DNA polymerase zeta catalytic subunit n=1 Tax=Purpureocillium takamizusanense TaxID=2060973 RepID=A0A9Q8QTI5_9HYPO|nr:DNA-directed DNA polymerase [Purpureocillium takamizusanense]UNI24404.1 DNA-directed DNA polymerase [Purpureocillium takamizusanense]